MKRLGLLVAATLCMSACGPNAGKDLRATQTSGALAKDSKPNPNPLCIAPWGTDLCAATGINTAFATPFFLGGQPVPVGNWWTPILGWAVNARGGLLPEYPLTYRPDYVPAYPNDPMQDFISKIVKFTLIIDPGTRQERTYVYDQPATYEVFMKVGDFWPPGIFGDPRLDSAQWMEVVPKLHPLSPGDHELHAIWTLSAEHCDGFPSFGGEPLTVEGNHCIPAGDYAYFPLQHVYTFGFEPRSGS